MSEATVGLKSLMLAVALLLKNFGDCYGFGQVPRIQNRKFLYNIGDRYGLQHIKTKKSLLLYSGNNQWANNAKKRMKTEQEDMEFTDGNVARFDMSLLSVELKMPNGF